MSLEQGHRKSAFIRPLGTWVASQEAWGEPVFPSHVTGPKSQASGISWLTDEKGRLAENHSLR